LASNSSGFAQNEYKNQKNQNSNDNCPKNGDPNHHEIANIKERVSRSVNIACDTRGTESVNCRCNSPWQSHEKREQAHLRVFVSQGGALTQKNHHNMKT
jgi:hypothetical protein